MRTLDFSVRVPDDHEENLPPSPDPGKHRWICLDTEDVADLCWLLGEAREARHEAGVLTPFEAWQREREA